MKKYKEKGTCRMCQWSADNPPRCEYKEIIPLDTLDREWCSSGKFWIRDEYRNNNNL